MLNQLLIGSLGARELVFGQLVLGTGQADVVIPVRIAEGAVRAEGQRVRLLSSRFMERAVLVAGREFLGHEAALDLDEVEQVRVEDQTEVLENSLLLPTWW